MGCLKADDALYFPQDRGLPAVHLELLGIELDGGQRGVRGDLLIRGDVLRPQLQPALPALRPVGQAVDGEAQVRQDLVVDDVVEKYGVRVEGFLRQDDAIFEWPVLADGDVP